MVADIHTERSAQPTRSNSGDRPPAPTDSRGTDNRGIDSRGTDGQASAGQDDARAVLQRLIHTRRSIRRYQAAPIPTAVLEDVLEAARWAPSAHNRQPWRFCVVTRSETKTALSWAMGERWRADLSADGAAPDFIERRVAISHARITGAGALVAVALSMVDMDAYPDAKRAHAEWTMATQSVALACQNLLLAAHANGLGGCWMCAPLFVPDLVREILDLPDDWEPQALLTLGYPAEEKQKDRAPLADCVVWR